MIRDTSGSRHAIRGSLGPWRSITAISLALSTFWTPFANAAALGTRAEPIANGMDLKILAIGDSITYGAGRPFCEVNSPSINCNGYRKPLYESLTELGNKIEFVGATSAGDFPQNSCEGHRGERIDEIQDHSLTGIYAAPNIVLLHIGTNDVKDQETDYANVEDQLEELISLIYEQSPGALVLLCTIIPADPQSYSGTAGRIPDFNDKVSRVYDHFKGNSKKIVLVDMNSKLLLSDLSDGLHPNSGGYDKMAAAFADEIKQSEDKISEAGKGSDPPTSTNPDNCRATPSWYKTGEIAKGAKVADTDGPFVEKWDEKRALTNGFCLRGHARLMDLDGDGVKDYACVDPDTGRTSVWRNKGTRGKISDQWEDEVEVATGAEGRKGNSVIFADLNADGRDDYIYIDPRNGYVYAWINQGKKGDKYLWENIGLIASGVTATTKTLQMVDLDGDGRADLCMVNPDTGEVTGWLNTGVDHVPDYYRIPGILATGASKGENDIVFMGDFTGEGRADYMLVHENAEVTGFINRLRSDRVAPNWSLSVTVAAGPDGVDQDAVRMIDMDGDGQVDYITLGSKGQVNFWRNKGTGGKYQEGEGVFLCDLDGDGAMDYFWVNHEGKGWGYLNAGRGKDVWTDLGPIATTGGQERRKIRMAVLTKSKRADYVVVDDDTGRAEWWQNLGASYNYNWAYRGVAAEGPAETLKNKFGWEPFKGENVRFADLDNDGLDDYIYIHEDEGAVAWFKNTGVADKETNPQWGLPHLVADGVGVAPRDIQFANTDGQDGLDYVTVGRISGKATTWHNLGLQENDQGDLSIRWNTPLPFADGTGPGQNIRLADMTGDGRADYVAVDPETGSLTLWQNRCWPNDEDGGGDGGDDDGGDDGDDDKFPWEDRHVDEFCGELSQNKGLSPEEKSYIWGSDGRGLGVGEWLDREIGNLDEGDDHWLGELVGLYRKKLDLSAWDQWQCDNIYGFDHCDIGDLQCEDFFDKDLAPLWWVARATSRLNEWVKGMTDRMTIKILESSLAIESMIETFGHAEEDTQAFDIFMTVLGAASTATSASTPVSAGISGISSFLTLMDQLSPSDEANDRLMAEGVLGMLFTSSMRSLRASLHLAIQGVYSDRDRDGVGSDEEDIEDENEDLHVSDLPLPDESSYKTPTAQFFQGGQWLLDQNKMESNLYAWSEKYAEMGKQAIAMALLRDQNWFVFINEANDDEGKCEVKVDDDTWETGRRWVNGMCADLWIFLEDDPEDVGAEAARDEARTKFDALQDKDYSEVNLADMYENAIDCALKFPNGDGAGSTSDFRLVTGQYPTCFFNIPVIRGAVLRYGTSKGVGAPETVPFINTSGRKTDEWGDV